MVKYVYWPMRILMVRILPLLCAYLRHFPALVEAGHVFVAMPPLFRIDAGKEVFYALDDAT